VVRLSRHVLAMTATVAALAQGSVNPVPAVAQPPRCTGASTPPGGVDLGEIAPSGQVALGGDAFSGNGMGVGVWSPSIAIRIRPGSLNGPGLPQTDCSFGAGDTLYADRGYPPGGSQLPAGTIQVNGIDYALVTWTDPHLQPVNSRLVRINPNGPGWPTVPGSWRDAGWQDGNETQISGYQAPDGWVYIVADGFEREHTVRLYRCPAASFTDRDTWHAWGMIDGGPAWGWDVAPTPLSNDRFGELSLRLIEDKVVLSGFNKSTGSVEARVADNVTQVLAAGTPVSVVADQQTLPQNYGGYIVPGSTLDKADILVSQWNTITHNPYNVHEFEGPLNH
jgi:Domain of unknown function (DUF4185)